MDRVAIIGTRLPDVIQTATAFTLARLLTTESHITVRTGAAEGVDLCAMRGAIPEMLEVVLPWERYNRELIPAGATVIVAHEQIVPHWYKSVEALHPNPARLSTPARHLHARNYGIVEGTILVVALPNERGTGGTAQGIRIAHSLAIPVIQSNRGSESNSEVILGNVRAFLKQLKTINNKEKKQ